MPRPSFAGDGSKTMEKLSTATTRLGTTPGWGRRLCGAGRWPGAEFLPEVGPHGEWRVPSGSKPTLTKPASRLTDEERDDLARRRIAGEKLSVLAEEAGVTDGYVSRLAKNFQEKEKNPLPIP